MNYTRTFHSFAVHNEFLNNSWTPVLERFLKNLMVILKTVHELCFYKVIKDSSGICKSSVCRGSSVQLLTPSILTTNEAMFVYNEEKNMEKKYHAVVGEINNNKADFG